MRWLVPLLTLSLLSQAPQQQPAGPSTAQTSSAKPPDKTGVAAMTPSEAFEYATQPFNEARSQPNDLTEADRWALGVSMQRATEACQALTPYKEFNEQLLSVGKLCLFGQQFEAAAEALVPYLSVPNSKYEEAGLLLSRAYIGMGQVTAAESQLETLLERFPYDAGIHFGIDTIVEAAEGRSPADDLVIQRLNTKQLPFMLHALRTTGFVTNDDKSAVATAATLFQDSLRCAAELRADGKQKDADDLVGQLTQIAASPQFAQSSQRPGMQMALKRYQLVGTKSPVRLPHTRLVSRDGSILPHFLNLQGKSTVLIVVALSAPASVDAVTGMTALLKAAPGKAPPAAIYAVTSYAANGGDEANPVAGLAQGLHGLAQGLPPSIPLYLLDDASLQAFGIDQPPMAIALDAEGRIRFLAPLVTQGDGRLLRDAVIPRKSEPASDPIR